MYFAKFDSFTSALNNSKAVQVVVDKVDGTQVISSPIPSEVIEDVLDQIGEMEAGNPFHLWKGPSKELVIVPFAQISAVRLVFQ